MTTTTQTKKTTKTTGAAAASAAPAPPDAPARFVLTSALAVQAMERRTAIHDFALTATMPGAIARVQHVDLSDTDTLTRLPQRLLGEIIAATTKVESAEGRPPVVAEDGTVDVPRAVQAARSDAMVFDAYCVSGFVEPALILTEGERVRDDQVLLSVIHPADRRRFFNWCQGNDQEANETVAAFPDGPAPGVAAGGPGGVAGAPAEPAADAAGAGV